MEHGGMSMMNRGPNKGEFAVPQNSHSCCHYSPTFLREEEEEAQQLEVSGIEMMVVPTVSYTSLRDIMPLHPNNASWNEIPDIPIKNPLLKQAALAYLQPMSTTPPDPHLPNKGFLHSLWDNCFCGCAPAATAFSCFRWLNGAVFSALLGGLVGFFCERTMNRNEDQRHDDEDEEEDEGNVDWE